MATTLKNSHDIDIYAAETSRIQALTDLLKYIPHYDTGDSHGRQSPRSCADSDCRDLGSVEGQPQRKQSDNHPRTVDSARSSKAMSTAVLISGQARTYGHCFANQFWNVYRKLDDPSFFVSVANDENAAAMDQLTKKFGTKRVFIERVNQPDLDENQQYELAKRHSGWAPSVPTQAILRQAWHLARVWDWMRDNAEEKKFHHFVRIRPDSHFHNCALPSFPLKGVVYVPFWGSWGGIPDRFAFISGVDAAQQYFNYYHKIAEMLAEGCPFHPETMHGYALERAGIAVHQTINCEFTTIRTKAELDKGRPHDKAVYTTQDILRFSSLIREATDR